ncbi:ceramide kinase isoform X1 [Populus nigra]|uniref:ceramide kinase isoform X1 n=1 Tax=Populus nigra TaxID=3691 RepID=UPI002B279AD3|nr:ceramide kinase isoform X1 [Populus nigra]
MEMNREDYKSDPKVVESGNVGEATSSASSSVLKSTLLLENVGDVVLTLNSDGLSLEFLGSSYNDGSITSGIKPIQKFVNEIRFSDVYGVEFINYGLINVSRQSKAEQCFQGRASHESEMYRFTVHSFQKSRGQPCLWVLAVYSFGHKDLQTCQTWVDRINASLNLEMGRPKKLLVFINPMSGKASGRRTWEMVAPIFSRAKVKTKVIVTERAGHAFDEMASAANNELKSYNGVIAVGGDGFFNEILNGFLLSRHKAPRPPSPSDIVHSDQSSGNGLFRNPNERVTETTCQNEDHSPLLSNSVYNGTRQANFRTEDGTCNIGQDFEFPLPGEEFRFGIIPAGSTDAIVMCTTGTRDPITSALNIVLGKKVCLDIAQVVRWKTTTASDIEPYVRYAASFAGYGFYGDVIAESEKYRWMGPKRYDYAGTKVFLRHSSYEAEVAYIETESEKTNPTVEKGQLFSGLRKRQGPKKSERVVCRTNCGVCNTKSDYMSKRSPCPTPYSSSGETRWLRSKGTLPSLQREEDSPSILNLWSITRRQLLRLLLLASRVSGIWMASSSKHTSFLHKYFEALLACLHPALKFSRTPFRWLSCYIIDLLDDLKCIPTRWPDSRALEMVWHQLRPEVVVFSPPYCIAGQKKKNYRIAIGYSESDVAIST